MIKKILRKDSVKCSALEGPCLVAAWETRTDPEHTFLPATKKELNDKSSLWLFLLLTQWSFHTLPVTLAHLPSAPPHPNTQSRTCRQTQSHTRTVTHFTYTQTHTHAHIHSQLHIVIHNLFIIINNNNNTHRSTHTVSIPSMTSQNCPLPSALCPLSSACQSRNTRGLTPPTS